MHSSKSPHEPREAQLVRDRWEREGLLREVRQLSAEVWAAAPHLKPRVAVRHLRLLRAALRGIRAEQVRSEVRQSLELLAHALPVGNARAEAAKKAK